MKKSSTINVQNAQKEWLKKYVEIGKQQVQKSIETQKHLKRNIFSRISNRQEIRKNDEYINSLSGALTGVETRQELYLHKPIELTAPSRIEEPWLQDMVQTINDKYNEKIQTCIENITLENFEKTYQEYRSYELDLSNMNTFNFMKNKEFPSFNETLDPERWKGFVLDTEYGFDRWEGDFYKLPTTKEYPDNEVMAFIKNQNSFQETGEAKYLKEAGEIRETFSSDTLKKINEYIDECVSDYKHRIEAFTFGLTDSVPIFVAVDRMSDDLKITNQTINVQELKERKTRFTEIYNSLPKVEQAYLNTFNEFKREQLSNEYSDTLEGKSYIQRNVLVEQESHLTIDQIERLKKVYHDYVSTSINGTESGERHMDNFAEVIQEWKELQLEDIVTTLSQLTPQQREYLENMYLYSSFQEEISNLSEAMNENEELMRYSENQLQSVVPFEKENASIVEKLEQIGESTDKRTKEIEILKEELTAVELDEVDFIFKNVENFEYEIAIQTLVEIENESQELAMPLNKTEVNVKEFSREHDKPQNSEELLIEEIDLKKIAEEKAYQNQTSTETLDVEKEEVIKLYSIYLEGAGLNHTEWNKVISYDKTHDSFEQMHYRLEAIDEVKLKNPSVDLEQKENKLCVTRGDKEQMHKIIHNEYYQIERSKEKESSKKVKQEQSMAQQMMM